MHIAIVGCGQLSRMLALAGVRMGIKFSFVAESNEDTRCVDGLGTIVRWQSGNSPEQLFRDLGEPGRITVEREQLSVELLKDLEQFCPVYPSPQAVQTCQHRYREKQLLEKLDIACTPYLYSGMPGFNLADSSLPAVIKTCSGGYDGKNQWVIKDSQDVDAFIAQEIEHEFIVEEWIEFEREVSQVSVRSEHGEIVHYPLTQNRHDKGILRQSIAPAEEISQNTISAAQTMISRIMNDLDYVGVLAVECFLLSGKLIVNELAPRVHNSGHWTQSGAATCQFENHLRAIAGLTLGSTEVHGPTGMLNLIGLGEPPLDKIHSQCSLHWYGKTQRAGRKAGHINFSGLGYADLEKDMANLEKLLG